MPNSTSNATWSSSSPRAWSIPGGQLVNSNEETEESEDLIEPPILPEVPFYKK
jgi:hypothetical protein